MNRYILLDSLQYLKNEVVINFDFSSMLAHMNKNRIRKLVILNSNEHANHSLYYRDFHLVSSRIEATEYGLKPVMRFSADWAENERLQDVQIFGSSAVGEDNVKDECINIFLVHGMKITCPYRMTALVAEFHSMADRVSLVKITNGIGNL
jgi:UDP-N-acetylmuramoylalanine-D-glutamate ligase